MLAKILVWFLLLSYLAFVIFIYIGAGFITKALFKSADWELRFVGINNDTELNIAKMTIILFWIVFIPLSLLPIALFAGYGKYF
jgi:hypothetical protein